MIVLGSVHSAGTLRLREFLGRNGHPYTYIDLDRDSQAQNCSTDSMSRSSRYQC